MKKNTLARIVATAVGASALLIAGTAQAALQDRDLDGNSVVDAFYDTDLDITWLRDADVNGTMTWDTAVAWADGFSFAGYDDWRLPMGDGCRGYCSSSEMGHLWYVGLGNSAGSMTNTGDFQNLHSSNYWSGTGFDAYEAVRFNANFGDQYASPKSGAFYAMAVRAGDVPAIPEPQTYALMSAGLGILTLARRRRSN